MIGEAVADQDPKQAEPFVDDAVTLLGGELQNKPQPPWLLYRLVRLGVRVGKTDKVKGVPPLIGDAGLRGRALLELLRAELAANGGKGETSQADPLKDLPAYPLALEAIARHNAQLDGGTLSAVGEWPENVRPYGQAGAAVGVQDAKK
jgi:hypothetical protein